MKKTKILSLLLSLALLVGVVNPGVLATEAHADDQSTGSSSSGMEISKTATANEDGTYTITLEAYATGSKVISTTKKDIPTDIVLVLDQSGSMDNCIVCGEEIGRNSSHTVYTATTEINENGTYYIKNGSQYTEVYYCNGVHEAPWGDLTCSGPGWYTGRRSNQHTANTKITPKTADNSDGTQFYTATNEPCTSRLDSLKSAVTTFANNVATKAKGDDGQYDTADDVNHRIAVVGFAAGSDSSYGSYYNTEVFVGSSQYKYPSPASSQYENAFQNMNTEAGYKNVIASKDALDAKGGTHIQLGMAMANGIFESNSIDNGEERIRVVVVFTDGVPSGTGSAYNSSVADSALQYASQTKNTYKATVYAVGIFAGADATNGGNSSGSETEKANWFMQNLSSNNGTVQNPGYYLSAGDTTSLNNIFKQISDQIETGGSSTTLSSETVIKDIISDQFELPAGATENDITLETWACTGKPGNDYTWEKKDGTMGATATVSDGQVSVTGFDFAANYVGTVTENGTVSYRGHKLVISFKVKPKDGFLGGNDVYTNTSAGVYENSSATEPVLKFNRPQVNVAINDLTVTSVDKNVYLLGDLTSEQIKSGATVMCGDVELKLNEANYGLEAWQYAYVDITVEIKGEDGKVVADLASLSDDTTYTVSAKVSPKTPIPTSNQGARATEKTETASGNINVFKPELTYKDSTVYYGDIVPAEYTGNLTSTKWKHGTTEASPATMTGTEPTLVMTYTPDSTKIESDKVNTKQDIAVDVAVKIGTADITDKTTFNHTACGANCTDPETGGRFWLHVKTCQLTIIKTGGADDESYVFDVYKDDQKYTEISVWGNGSVTIYELPVGSYTIKENAGWSWRYTADNGSAANLTAQNSDGSITCANTKEMFYWLNGFSSIVKNIFEGRD